MSMTTQRLTPKELLRRGEDIRNEDPVLWAFLRGRSGTRFIALLIGMPPARVEEAIEEMVQEGVLRRAANNIPQLSREYEMFELYSQIKAFYEAFELQVHKKYADAKWEKGHFTNAVEKIVAEGKKAGPSGRPTARQTELGHLILAEFDTNPFKSADFAKAQGYKGSTRATANYLNAMANKGLLENLGASGRGSQTWQLTKLGVEWLEQGRWDDSQAEERAKGKAYEILKSLGEASTRRMSEELAITASGAHRQMARLADKGYIEKVGEVWRLKQ
ncbi:helix-turn-helix DNA-binding domain protein [Microbacterium phage Triscuit]|nr:helix-turn-helix DNA-binding domain protein [Microbacterium phage Triscuit]